MYLLVIGNPEKAKQLLKTNREIKVGDKLKGDVVMISKLAAQHTDTFELGGVEEKVAKKKVTKKSSHKPKKNKALKKGNKFKSKA